MRAPFVSLAAAVVVVGLVAAGCAPSAPPPTPTKAPAPTAAPTKPAAAPTKAPEATKPAAAPTKAPEPTKPAATAAPTAAPAKKVAWPDKSKAISIIVPFAAGGSTDNLTRMLAPLLERELGTSVQVVNRAGAATQVANTELVQSKPDGYTIELISLVSAVSTYVDPDRKATYTGKDFQPLANLTMEHITLAVKTDSLLKDIKGLLDAAKAKPDQVKTGTTGAMGSSHLAIAGLAKAAGVKFAFVHFDGNAPATTALLGGHVDTIAAGSGATYPQAKPGGTLRVIGHFSRDETKFFPGVKPAFQLGFDVIVPGGEYGYAAPAGTPREIVDIWAAAFKKASENADFVNKMADLTMEPMYMDTARYVAHWAETERRTKALIDIVKAEQK